MTRRFSLLLLALVACQQAPASSIDVAVADVERSAVPAAANERVTTSVADAPHDTPDRGGTAHTPHYRVPFEVKASSALSPPGATMGSQIDFVTIGVDLSGADSGELAIEFFSPDGTPYERRSVQTDDLPLGSQHFDFVLPVAGTWIQSSALTGTWYARVYFKGSERLAEPFDLTP